MLFRSASDTPKTPDLTDIFQKMSSLLQENNQDANAALQLAIKELEKTWDANNPEKTELYFKLSALLAVYKYTSNSAQLDIACGNAEKSLAMLTTLDLTGIEDPEFRAMAVFVRQTAIKELKNHLPPAPQGGDDRKPSGNNGAHPLSPLE